MTRPVPLRLSVVARLSATCVPVSARHLPEWDDAPQEYAARTVSSDSETRKREIREGGITPTDG